MKLKIDTAAKIIQLEQSAKLTDLITLVKKLFPNDEWKQYSIEVVQYIYNWSNPFFIPTVWKTDIQFDDQWTITCSDNTETFCIQTN